MLYHVLEFPTDGTVGQDCGEFLLGELPERLRLCVESDTSAGSWTLPALSGGDTGDELDDLYIRICRED